MPDIAVVMPKLSMTMTEGEVVAWRRNPGEAVREGDVVAEVLTDKVEMEVESPATGILARLVADTGDRVPVGEPMAWITAETDGLLDGIVGTSAPAATTDTAADATANDAPDAAARAAADGAAEEPAGQPDEPAAERPVPPSRKSGTPALPGARRRAAALSVDLETITGTGPDGAISVGDVESAADSSAPPAERPSTPVPPTDPVPSAEPAPPTPAADPPGRAPAGDGPDPGFADALAPRRAQIRSAVAAIMSASVEIPQFTVWHDLDLDAADAMRTGVSWTAVLIAAFARALREDAALGGDPGSVHVSLAVDTPVGLLGPVVRGADALELDAVDAAVRAAAQRARNGRLTKDDLAGGTTTFSNLGSWGVDSFSALLTPPQCSALSVGAVGPRPVARGRSLSVATTCRVGLTVDHRAADGADAARVLQAMSQLLAEPRRLR